MLQEQLRGRGARQQLVDFAIGRVGYVERLIRSDRKIVARAVVAWKIPADLRRAGGELKASESGMALHWMRVWYRGELAGPQHIVGGIRQHAKEKRSRAF